LVIPMFGRYLVTTMILVALSTMISVVTVNFRFRSGTANKMSPWIRSVFLVWLPKILLMSRPDKAPRVVLQENPINTKRDHHFASKKSAATKTTGTILIEEKTQKDGKRGIHKPSHSTRLTSLILNGISNKQRPVQIIDVSSKSISDHSYSRFCGSILSEKNFENTSPLACIRKLPEQNDFASSLNKISSNNLGGSVYLEGKKRAESVTARTFHSDREYNKERQKDLIFKNLIRQVRFIAEYFHRIEDEAEISDDWTFVAMVLDRLFLIIFSVLNVTTLFILLEAPSLRDHRQPLNMTIPTKPLGQAIFSVLAATTSLPVTFNFSN